MEYYTYPAVVSLPLGYDCTTPIPISDIKNRIVGNQDLNELDLVFSCYRAGRIFHEIKLGLNFAKGELVGDAPLPIVVPDQLDKNASDAGFAVMSVVSRNDVPVFRSKSVFSFYAVYSKPGKKSFLSDNAYKYGSPPTISQMAEFGQYVDAYPIVHLDKSADIGETIALINPYKRPILATLQAHDGRKTPRIKIEPESVHNQNLGVLLKEDENSWAGHIQLTANNRLISFSLKHSFTDFHLISDHEHLDPFRSDPTHLPATIILRRWLGRQLGMRRAR